jgi:hypothetical protein
VVNQDQGWYISVTCLGLTIETHHPKHAHLCQVWVFKVYAVQLTVKRPTVSVIEVENVLRYINLTIWGLALSLLIWNLSR